jgi:hypothetical protein
MRQIITSFYTKECQVEALETLDNSGNVAFREPQCDKAILETFDHLGNVALRVPQGDKFVSVRSLIELNRKTR